MQGCDEFGDLAFIEPTFLMQGDPAVPTFGVDGKQQACQLPQVLACMEQIDDLNGSGKMLSGEVPDPSGAVANNDLLVGAAPAAFPRLDVESPAELLGV